MVGTERPERTCGSAASVHLGLHLYEPACERAARAQEAASIVGKIIANKCKDKGVTQIVFDRAGFEYASKVKAVADGAREAGLEF